MAVTIDTAAANKITRLSNADTATGWSVVKIEGSGGAPSLLASVGTIDSVKEGTDARAARTNKQRVAIRYNYTPGVDFTPASTGTGTLKYPSGNIYHWGLFLAAGALFTKANGGFQIYASDGTNVSYWNVAGSDTYDGGFFKWATSTLNTPSETSGTAANLGNITFIGLVTDVGGATTRFDNFVADALDVGFGLTFDGTTTTDALFTEAAAIDNATAEGILQNFGGVIYSQGNLEFSGTSQTSDTESLIFRDSLNGAYTYTLDITGTVVFNNSQVSAEGAVDYDFDSSAATAFTMGGGGLYKFKTLTLGAGQAINNATFQDGGTSTISADLTGCTVNKCGQVSLLAVSNGCNFTDSSGTSAAVVDDLAKLSAGTFKSIGTGHAVELTSIGGGSMDWSCTTTGYDAGVSGSPVTPTSTGNEDIYISATTGTITINVVDGATIPSIRSEGAVVNVVAGLSAFVLTGVVSGSALVVKALAGGSLTAGEIMIGPLVVTTDPYNAPSQVADQPFALTLANASGSPKYVRIDENGNTGSGYSRNFEQVLDE